MAIALADFTTHKKSPEYKEAHVREFLTPTLQTKEGDKPTIVRHYGDTFNSVDRFNRILAHISYLPRTPSYEILLLHTIFQTALIMAWALDNDWKCDQLFDEEGEYVLVFGKALCRNLLRTVIN